MYHNKHARADPESDGQLASPRLVSADSQSFSSLTPSSQGGRSQESPDERDRSRRLTVVMTTDRDELDRSSPAYNTFLPDSLACDHPLASITGSGHAPRNRHEAPWLNVPSYMYQQPGGSHYPPSGPGYHESRMSRYIEASPFPISNLGYYQTRPSLYSSGAAFQIPSRVPSHQETIPVQAPSQSSHFSNQVPLPYPHHLSAPQANTATNPMPLLNQQSLPHGSTTDVVIAGYADQMRGYYRTAIPQYFSLTWPPPPTNKIFNLSIISHDQYNYGRGNDELVRLLYLGKVDQVMAKKSNVELKDLFHLDSAKRKVVLIEGAPGAGKSTLAWHICQKWETGELFQEFKLVVFVQLRDPAIQSAKSLADLLPAQLKSVAREVVSRMETKGGEGLLFVLDGWDEFPPGLRGNEVIKKVICDPSAVGMPSSTLLITSRPIASGSLHRYASSRVETIGFKQTELNLYFKEALKDDCNKIQELEDGLKERPVIKASCYLPLNTVIVVHLFLSLNNRLPNTLHGVFLQLVIHSIVRHIMKQQDEDSEPPHISCLDDLPPDMQTQLSHICAMAYHGVMKNKVTFSEDDLKSFNLPPDISTLSLIQVVVSFMPYRSRSYNFLHLSVQELLTSYHISKLPPQEQVKIFKELFGQPRFAAVFQYYAAFTKLQTAGIEDVMVSIIQQSSKNLCLTLLHCLYEAQDSSLFQFVASEMKGKLDLSNLKLSPVDCIAVGYFLHQCAAICPMTAKLSKCSLDLYKLELLGKELKRPTQALKFRTCFDFSSGNADGKLTQLIATELIALANEDVSGVVISKLDLSHNPIQVGKDGLSHLCQALTTNTTLVELCLCNCKLTITKRIVSVLNHMLKTNKSLDVFRLSHNTINGCGVRFLSKGISSSAISKLDLSHNPIQDGEDGLSHLCQALRTNTSLVELNLFNCKLTITEVNGRALIHMLKTNKTLKSLIVLPIKPRDGYGLRYFLQYINSSIHVHSISKLDLSGIPIQVGEDGLSHLCQALTTNALSLVELNLSGCKLTITEENAEVLNCMLKTNKTLKMFMLSHNAINFRGVCYFSEGISSSAIRKLDLSHNPIQDGEDGLSHLCQALTTNTSLVELNFAGFTLRVSGRRRGEMAQAIKLLQLSKHAINGVTMRSLSYFISSSSAISKLDLSGNPIQDGEDGLSHLCQALTTNTYLVELNLSDCSLHDKEYCPTLRRMLENNKTLTSLDFSFQGESRNIAYIVEGLRSNHSLKFLKFSYCGIHDTGMKRITDCLMVNDSLDELHLGGNTISPKAAHGCRDMLKHNSTLKKLNVSGCELTDEAVKSLASALEVNSTLEELDLCRNYDLTNSALLVLGESLKKNKGLKALRMGSHVDKTTASGWRQFVECLKDNVSLELLRTHHCELNVEDINTVRRAINLPELRQVCDF